MSDIEVAWSAEEEQEYLEFEGTIVRAEFDTDWANSQQFEGGAQLRIEWEVTSPEGWQNQYSWYPPSNKKGSKWSIFRECLRKTGALKDLNIVGNTNREKLQSLAKQLVGMCFKVERHTDYKGWGGKILKKIDILTEYKGRVEVSPKRVESEKIELKGEL